MFFYLCLCLQPQFAKCGVYQECLILLCPCLDYVSMVCETPTGVSTSFIEKWEFDINILYCRLEVSRFKFRKLLGLVAGTLCLYL